MKNILRRISLVFMKRLAILFVVISFSLLNNSCIKRAVKKTVIDMNNVKGVAAIWVIDGKEYEIERISVMHYFNGDKEHEAFVYEIYYNYGKDIDYNSMTEEEALEIAYPIVSYAFKEYKIDEIKSTIKGKEYKITDFAVIIKTNISEKKIGSSTMRKANQYRVHLSIDEFLNRRKQQHDKLDPQPLHDLPPLREPTPAIDP